MKNNYFLLITLFLSVTLFGQSVVNIPDVNFKNALINHSPTIDTNSDGEIQLTEAEAFSGSLAVSNKNISDLTGIGAFINITRLGCSGNNLSTINISNNKKMQFLACLENHLKSLDITNNLDLKALWINSNEMETLDLSKNLALQELSCFKNNLSRLDVSKNLDLQIFYCYENNLTTIDISKNVNLKVLWCSNNDIKSLDVSKNMYLRELSCSNINLTSLDISKNLELDRLSCSNNKLTALDLSKHTKLERLNASNNQLTRLNLKNGVNTDFEHSFLNFRNNPDLTCIQVDDANFSNTNWSSIKDDTADFSEACDYVIVFPDANFKTALLNHDPVIDTNDDGEIQISEAESAITLNIARANINSLEGIAYFVNLEELFCAINNLDAIDISQNVKLKKLYCASNNLRELDIAKNTVLEELSFGFNGVKSIALTSTKLKLITATNGILEELLVLRGTTYPDLKEIYLTQNNLTQLFLPAFPNLEFLSCADNKLTSLDLSSNTKIKEVYAFNNLLTEVNLKNGNNENIDVTRGLTSFALNIDLDCIEVDDVAYSNANWQGIKDSATQFSEDCGAGLSITDFELASNTSVFPIPVIDDLTINSN
ncbi:leucine-rich repeat domain-containing protein [Aquimarina agarilytica]|uniref:leucine-rich repeat domain-containing protein n=1 Tax=Aquimarina agarilytica TaxID=1087449 RepID=UPI0002890110|nr:regulator of chromosome condensation RCC1 [Aquimarina agarilytica]